MTEKSHFLIDCSAADKTHSPKRLVLYRPQPNRPATNHRVCLFTGYPPYKVPMSPPGIKREEGIGDGATAGTSGSIEQLYQQLTGDSLRRSFSIEGSHDPDADYKVRGDDPCGDDDDIEDDDPRNDEPCDLRLLTPATCLREVYPSGDFKSHQNMVPYLGGLAESLISNITKLPTYPGSPAGPSTTGSVGGLTAGSAAIPGLKNLRLGPGSSSSSGGSGGTGGSNQTTPGGAYSCHRCGNSYARPHSLNRHIRFECGVEPKFECPVCHKKSKHKHNLVLHMRTHQQR